MIFYKEKTDKVIILTNNYIIELSFKYYFKKLIQKDFVVRE